MGKFSFEICQLNQINELRAYINKHWAKNHVLVYSKKLLDWQYKNVSENYYNFILARDNNSLEVCGLLGFIPTSHFSSNLSYESEVWLSIWKVNQGAKYIGLGLSLLKHLKENFNYKKICSVGISQIVYPMYQTLGYTVGELTQHVLINFSLPSYKIAVVPDSLKKNNFSEKSNGYELKEFFIESLKIDADTFNFPTKKNYEYFIKRFTNHPKYRYIFLGVFKLTKLVAFLVIRKIYHNDSSVLRIVDFQGDEAVFPFISKQLYKYLLRQKSEYMDLMQYGLDKNILKRSGFFTVKNYVGLVTPDYFEPFVQKKCNDFFC